MPLVTVSRLSVGRFSKLGLPVLAHTLPANAEIDGLLGMGFLQGLHVSIQMRQGVLTIEEDV